jgi:hypothetical protein
MPIYSRRSSTRERIGERPPDLFQPTNEESCVHSARQTDRRCECSNANHTPLNINTHFRHSLRVCTPLDQEVHDGDMAQRSREMEGSSSRLSSRGSTFVRLCAIAKERSIHARVRRSSPGQWRHRNPVPAEQRPRYRKPSRTRARIAQPIGTVPIASISRCTRGRIRSAEYGTVVWAWTLAPRSMRRRITSTWPLSAARMSAEYPF